ncbi:phosphoribosyltransferase-like protein [Spirosoma endophyticum]|uniref:PRTase-CE domain-containing protein n=1 Tax=Spirosoma endophyticum TaxID=662367 RepID=A0A1I2BDL8_9BACT|nr:hypothetical protein [Spirosoma endophyticum]SFE53240.1 hypothetical protein SAMN05216167_11545 [Spirosoma endophyticum]
MEELIQSIYETLEDYRADEDSIEVRITKDGIQSWINQFDEVDRLIILQELQQIFVKRYCSKNKMKEFLKSIVEELTKHFKCDSPVEFLRNSTFLDLQAEGKSQKIMLQLFNDFIFETYNMELTDCGTVSKKYSIYIDDILCTGNTLVRNIKDWSEIEFSAGKSNKQAVSDNSTILVIAYMFIHVKNYYKKKAEMKHNISQDISNKHCMYYELDVHNNPDSTLDIIWPLEANQPEIVHIYKNKVMQLVDEYTKSKGYGTSVDEFYRTVGTPNNESLFTNSENRSTVENAFLKKGIEILNASAVNVSNMRTLGFSLPSHKNFGFGTLCFTWRNVPNNTPLVFWYLGGGFIPLFKVKRGNSIF